MAPNVFHILPSIDLVKTSWIDQFNDFPSFTSLTGESESLINICCLSPWSWISHLLNLWETNLCCSYLCCGQLFYDKSCYNNLSLWFVYECLLFRTFFKTQYWKWKHRARETAQCWRALAALPEGLRSIWAPTWKLATNSNDSSCRSKASSGLNWCRYIQTCKHRPPINKVKQKIKLRGHSYMSSDYEWDKQPI